MSGALIVVGRVPRSALRPPLNIIDTMAACLAAAGLHLDADGGPQLSQILVGYDLTIGVDVAAVLAHVLTNADLETRVATMRYLGRCLRPYAPVAADELESFGSTP